MRPKTVIALSAACLIAGCGGSDPAAKPKPAGAADPAQIYREAVNRQCLDARLDRDVLPAPGGSGSEDLANYLYSSLAAARRSERKLNDIVPPPAVTRQHRRGRRLGREAIDLVAEAARDARRGEAPDKVLRRLEPAVNRRIDAGNRIAEELGTTQCRQEPLDLGFTR